MNKLALIAVLVSSGCYGAQLRSMETKLDSLERENTSLRRQNAQLRPQSPGDEGPKDVLPSASEPVPAAMPQSSPLPVPAVSSITEQMPEGYHCFVGDPTVGGNVVKLVNEHDHYWLRLMLNGKPVIVMRGSQPVLARADVSVLEPGSACYVPVRSRMVGRKLRRFTLSAVAYTEAHGSFDPLRPLLDSQPASYLKTQREFTLISHDRVTQMTIKWWMWK